MNANENMANVARAGLTIRDIAATNISLPAHIIRPLSFWEWAALGQQIAIISNWSPWALGDWWLHGHNQFGEDAAQAVNDLRIELKTLQNYAWVCSRFPASRRRELPISFAHHAEVAGLEPADADALLDAAQEYGWSRYELREARRAFLAGLALEIAPPESSGKDGADTSTDEIRISGQLLLDGGCIWVGMTELASMLQGIQGLDVEIIVRPLPLREQA